MDWILEDVAVGSWQDALDQSLLKLEKVGAILNVRSDENDAGIKEANEREGSTVPHTESDTAIYQL